MRGFHPAPTAGSNTIMNEASSAEAGDCSSSHREQRGSARIEIDIARSQAQGLCLSSNSSKDGKAFFSIALPYPEAFIPERFSLLSILYDLLHRQIPRIEKRDADMFKHEIPLSG